jgi:hypothetical protein
MIPSHAIATVLRPYRQSVASAGEAEGERC